MMVVGTFAVSTTPAVEKATSPFQCAHALQGKGECVETVLSIDGISAFDLNPARRCWVVCPPRSAHVRFVLTSICLPTSVISSRSGAVPSAESSQRLWRLVPESRFIWGRRRSGTVGVNTHLGVL